MKRLYNQAHSARKQHCEDEQVLSLYNQKINRLLHNDLLDRAVHRLEDDMEDALSENP